MLSIVVKAGLFVDKTCNDKLLPGDKGDGHKKER